MREMENEGGEQKEPLNKFTVKYLAEAFADLNLLFKKFENMDPTPEGFY